MKLTMYQVDAFTDHLFGGNPAAVCPLARWLELPVLQAIAGENNLAETAFFVPSGAGFELRWFTPVSEVDLCGHATLASAHVLYAHLGYREPAIHFRTHSGELIVSRDGTALTMDFPAARPYPGTTSPALAASLGAAPVATLTSLDHIAVYENAADVRALTPDFARLQALDLRGVIATAPGDTVDFVSRCFFPKLGIDEDPVTGSAHCELAPYWAARLRRNRLDARQISRRGGDLGCEVVGERVHLRGRAIDFMTATVELPDAWQPAPQ